MINFEDLKSRLRDLAFQEVDDFNDFRMDRDLGDLGTLEVWNRESLGTEVYIDISQSDTDESIRIADADDITAILDLVRITMKFSSEISERKYLEERLKAGIEEPS